MAFPPSAELEQKSLAETPREGTFSAPIELRLAWLFTAVFVVGLLNSYPINLPDAESLRFAQYHYFAPLLMAFAFQLPVAWLSGRKKGGDPWLLLKLLPLLVLAILIHFNFKAWMPLVNNRSYDDLFQAVDEWCWPVVTASSWLREAIQDVVPVKMDQAYHGMFVAMFFIAFSAHALFDRPERQRQLVLGICLILLLGGLLYWVAPALGPFLYREGVNEESTMAQGHMLRMFHHFVQSGEVPPGYFTAPLAAMPSLHVAHALFFTLFAAGSLRWLYWFFIPLLCWIVLESVASGWHYLIDLPVGAALALVALAMVKGLIPVRKMGPEKTAQDRETGQMETEETGEEGILRSAG